MDDYGYTEREFLFSGTANIYQTGEQGCPGVKYADCTYTDRMSLRMPVDQDRFSGRVVVEIVNSTANFDIDRVWAESYRYLMRHGDIFVGITSKANVFTALKRFDAERYGQLDWPNPSDEPVPDTDVPPIWTGPQDQETGYIWDILREIPAFLKSNAEENPLKGWPVKYVYLTGWSQSCSYITRFVTDFEKPEAHAYDGYLSTGGVRSLLTTLNRYESQDGVDQYRYRLNNAPAPVIELNTESECSDEYGLRGYTSRRPDSDEPGFRYRYMDIAGGCHDAVDTCMAYNGFDSDVAIAMNRTGGAPGNNFCRNNYRKYFAFHVALRNLYLWVEQGIAPKSYERMHQSADGRVLKDAFGNSIGGLRTPMVDYPVCRYINWSEETDPVTGKARMNILAGREEEFSSAMLKELYGDLDHYRDLVTTDTYRLIADGQILEEDCRDMIETAVGRAKQAGLN
ncbi:MAG: hypothetical protein K5891_03280 [Lachnospiraceae bacterium]|nr:hypothetical protein [Lachnospiraceae bacterium]